MVQKLSKGRYLVRVRVRRNGVQVQRKRIIDGTQEAAEALYVELKKEIREGASSLISERENSTFNDAIAVYLDKKSVSFSHRHKIDTLKEVLGNVELGFVADRFEKYLKLYRTRPTCRKKLPGNHSVNRMVEIVRAVFNLLRDLNFWKGENPISKARFPKLKEIPRDVILTDEDKLTLLNTVDREAAHLSAIVRYALQVPCRRSELVNMRREDLDIFGGVIRVRNGTTKNEMGCWKPIPPDMVDYFRTIPKESEFLFYRRGSNGEYLPLGNFKTAWKRVLRLAGVKNFRFHDTRHNAATALVDNGTPEQVVMTVAGWKTNMLRVYYNRSPKKALELLRFSPDRVPNCVPSIAANR